VFTPQISKISFSRTRLIEPFKTAVLSILLRFSKSAFLKQITEEMYFAKPSLVLEKLRYLSSPS